MPYYFRLPRIVDLTIEQQAALNETDAIAVSGGPGTGKSVVSLWRHIRNYGTGNKRSLLLTYTKTLETYLSATAKSIDEQAGSAVNRTYWWTYHKLEKYDEIIVDEAQDVQADKYHLIKEYADIVSYGADDQQMVFPEQFTGEKELASIFPDNKEHKLFENFRNTYEILRFVKSLFPSRLILDETINTLLRDGKHGNKPLLLISNNTEKQFKGIIQIISQFRSETHNIAILVPLKSHVHHYYKALQEANISCSKFTNEDGELAEIENVHITTFKSSKGTEFDTVIIPSFEQMKNNIANLNVVKENDYYVALTRAKRNLYLISSNDLNFLALNTYQRELL